MCEEIGVILVVFLDKIWYNIKLIIIVIIVIILVMYYKTLITRGVW